MYEQLDGWSAEDVVRMGGPEQLTSTALYTDVMMAPFALTVCLVKTVPVALVHGTVPMHLFGVVSHEAVLEFWNECNAEPSQDVGDKQTSPASVREHDKPLKSSLEA